LAYEGSAVWNKKSFHGCAASISSDEVEDTLSFRMVTHITSAQSRDVGDVDGHALSLVRFSGLAFLPDTVATVSFAAAIDYTNGAGASTKHPEQCDRFIYKQ